MPGIAVNVAVIHEDQILLTQRDDFEVWCLPSGGVELGESLAQAAVRETLEETGVEVELTRLVGVYSLLGFAGDGHAVTFAGEVAGGTLQPQAGEAVDLRFFAPDELPEALLAGHRQRIQDVLDGVRAASWRQEFVPRLFVEVGSRQEIYTLRDHSGLPRDEFYRQALESGRLAEVLEVGTHCEGLP
jgi:ADP-ribose pyrophosphatase YjhB (NUDIX family)